MQPEYIVLVYAQIMDKVDEVWELGWVLWFSVEMNFLHISSMVRVSWIVASVALWCWWAFNLGWLWGGRGGGYFYNVLVKSFLKHEEWGRAVDMISQG